MRRYMERWLIISLLTLAVQAGTFAQESTYHTEDDTTATVDPSYSSDYYKSSQYDYNPLKTEGFKPIYRFGIRVDTTSYTVQRSISPGMVEKWKSSGDYDYHPEEKKKEVIEEKEPGFFAKILNALNDLFSSGSFQVVMWIVLCIVFLLVLSWIVGFDYRIFFGGGKKQKTAEEVATDNENLMQTDLSNALAAALQQKNFKMAVRLMYLIVLKKMAEKKLITFRDDKTNLEYVRELYGTGYYSDFFKLTRIFEYTTYGHFDLTEEMFAEVQQGFDNFNKTV